LHPVHETTASILQALKEAGYKFTGKRRAVVDLFVENRDRYFSAKEVYDHVSQIYPSVSFDTIYRTLGILVEQNVIEPMEFADDRARYRLQCARGHHHHLVCLRCGASIPIEECPIDRIRQQVPNFHIRDHRLEIYGYCDRCADAGGQGS